MEYGESKVYVNGKELGWNGATSLPITPVTKDMCAKWMALKYPVSVSMEFKPDDETIRRLKGLQKEMMKDINRLFNERNKAINDWIEGCLRTRVVPPIKGEITKGKVKWRGLALCYGPGHDFLGILQRGKTLYSVDGNTYER